MSQPGARVSARRALMVGTCVTFVIAGATYVAPEPALQAQAAQASSVLPRGDVEHGRYLVERVAMCVECHSGRDEQGTILESRKYRGGIVPFSPPWPNNWATIVPPNRGLPGYDDAQALRLLTQGSVGRNGRQLAPPMPRFRMTTQDAADVIAFLRSAP